MSVHPDADHSWHWAVATALALVSAGTFSIEFLAIKRVAIEGAPLKLEVDRLQMKECVIDRYPEGRIRS
jgi:hypothetical protein